jgi:BirA family biotin operon repressor/biotin-[acetyl-CoA-carboxylase] ligase
MMTIDAQILAALRNNKEGSVSGGDLAQKLGISRAAIWARIEELRTLGYDIEASPHKGYRLLNTPDLLHGDDLLARLGGEQIIGRDIRVFDKTNSTNDVVEKLARDGVKEGVVVIAESQSQGRGRLGRKWVSPSRKGLWMSLLLRPQFSPQAITRITIATVTSLARAVRKVSQTPVAIKWPNDLLIRGKKVSGILTELSAEVDKIKYVIVGVGVNVNLEPKDFPAEVRATATSLRIEAGRLISRAEMATAFLQEFELDYAKIQRGKFESVSDEWVLHCSTIGQQVRIQVANRQIAGRAEALDADGALLVRASHGHLERIVGGDVILEKSQEASNDRK